MYSHKPVVEQEPSKLNRREFSGGMLALAAACIGCSGEKAKRKESWAKDQEAFEQQKEQLRTSYLPNAELPDTAQLVDLFLDSERLRSAGKNPGAAYLTSAEFNEQHLNPVQQDVDKRLQKMKPALKENTLAKLIQVKRAVQEKMGNTYNADFEDTTDPFNHQKRQCRSGSHALMVFMLQNKDKLFKEGEEPSYIYTKGHVIPGYQTSEGELVGLESTTNGNGVVNFGQTEDFNIPGRICRPEHILAQNILGTKEHTDKVITKATIPISVKGSDIEPFCFGTKDVEKGDKPIRDRNQIDPEEYRKPEILRRNISGGEATMPSGQTGETKEEMVEGESMTFKEYFETFLNPKEKAIVMKYYPHHEYFLREYNNFAPLFNRSQQDPNEFVKGFDQMIAISTRVGEYIKANPNTFREFEATKKVLDSHNIRLVGPEKAFGVTSGNLKYLIEKYK